MGRLLRYNSAGWTGRSCLHDVYIAGPVFIRRSPARTLAGVGVGRGSVFVPVAMLVVGF